MSNRFHDAAACAVHYVEFYRRRNFVVLFGGVDSSFQVGQELGFRKGWHLIHRKIVHQDSGLELIGPLDGTDLRPRYWQTLDHLLDRAVEVFHGLSACAGGRLGSGWNRGR